MNMNTTTATIASSPSSSPARSMRSHSQSVFSSTGPSEPISSPTSPPHSPRSRASRKGPIAVNLASPTRAQLKSEVHLTLRSSVQSIHSATLAIAHAMPASAGGSEALTTLRVNLHHETGELRELTIPSGKMRVVLRGKLSSTWLEYYLQYLHRTKKTESLFLETANTAQLLPSQVLLTKDSQQQPGLLSYGSGGEGEVDSDYCPSSGAGGGLTDTDGDETDVDATAAAFAADGGGAEAYRPVVMNDLPMALVRALNGQIHTSAVCDKVMDTLVCKHSRSLISQATLDEEVRIRLCRWVGNVDATGDYAQRLRIALKLAAEKFKRRRVRKERHAAARASATAVAANGAPETPTQLASPATATTTANTAEKAAASDSPTTPSISQTPASGGEESAQSATSGASTTGTGTIFGLPKEFALRAKKTLLRSKREEHLTSERLDCTITRELFWKYISYCRENHRSIVDKAVCSWDEWLIWRHDNFGSTHLDIQKYKQAATKRLQSYSSSGLDQMMVSSKEFATTGATAISALTSTMSGTMGSTSNRFDRSDQAKANVAFGRSVVTTKPLDPPSPPPAEQETRVQVNSQHRSHHPSMSVKVPSVPALATVNGAANGTPHSKNASFQLSASSEAEIAAAAAKAKARAETKRLRQRNYHIWTEAKREANAAELVLKKEADSIAKRKEKARKKSAAKAFAGWEKQRSLNCFSVVDKNTGEKVVKAIKADSDVKHIQPWNPYISTDKKKDDRKKKTKRRSAASTAASTSANSTPSRNVSFN